MIKGASLFGLGLVARPVKGQPAASVLASWIITRSCAALFAGTADFSLHPIPTR